MHGQSAHTKYFSSFYLKTAFSSISEGICISLLIGVELVFCCCLDTILRESIPLGMENGLILDSQLSASSEKYYYISGAASGRLNSETVPNERHGGWIAADDDSAPWLQVDFIINATITAIITQGLDTGGNYVKEYTVTFNNSKTGMQNYIGKSTGQVTVRRIINQSISLFQHDKLFNRAGGVVHLAIMIKNTISYI